METVGGAPLSRGERRRRQRIRAEKIETALIVALAALVLFKGAPVIAGIVFGIGEMFLDLWRLWRAA